MSICSFRITDDGELDITNNSVAPRHTYRFHERFRFSSLIRENTYSLMEILDAFEIRPDLDCTLDKEAFRYTVVARLAELGLTALIDIFERRSLMALPDIVYQYRLPETGQQIYLSYRPYKFKRVVGMSNEPYNNHLSIVVPMHDDDSMCVEYFNRNYSAGILRMRGEESTVKFGRVDKADELSQSIVDFGGVCEIQGECDKGRLLQMRIATTIGKMTDINVIVRDQSNKTALFHVKTVE